MCMEKERRNGTSMLENFTMECFMAMVLIIPMMVAGTFLVKMIK